MKRIVKSLIAISLFALIFVGCTNEARIQELQTEIEALEDEITLQENSLARWQAIYDDAHNTYYAPHSDSELIQSELQRTKEIMDDAQKEINAIKREISLIDLQIEQKEKEINSLQND